MLPNVPNHGPSHGVPWDQGSFNMWRVEETFPQSNISGSGVYFTKPHLMVSTTHVHDCDEHLFFLGTNFEDMNDFDAEIELYMGEEGEKHIITVAHYCLCAGENDPLSLEFCKGE